MSQENVEIVREAIDALNRGDLDAWLGFLSPTSSGRPCRVSLGLESCTAGGQRRGSGSSSSSNSEAVHTEIEQLTDSGDDRVFLAIGSLHAEGAAASRLRCPTGR